MNCQHCKQVPAVLQDRYGVLCARCWMTINNSCRPDVASTPGLEHGQISAPLSLPNSPVWVGK